MKKLIIVATIFLGSALAVADDPWMPDTVIIGTIYVDLGQPYGDVPIFAVTDERVWYYNFPITWSLDSEGIEPSDVFYHYMLEHWDETYDSLLVDQHFMRMYGWLGLVPFDLYLDTDSLRLRCWTVRFTIDSLAPQQIVAIDTTYDPINGSLLFGLVGGVEIWIPVVIPGAIYYGIPSETYEDRQFLPSDIALLQNYPNPFNASTTIEFTLPDDADVELSVYDLLGRKVAILVDEFRPAGNHQVIFDAKNLASGIYFYALRAGDAAETGRMVLLK